MAAATYNITVEQGATWRKTITIKDNQTPAVVINLTGCTIAAQIRERYDDASPLASFTIENQDLVNGKFDLVLPYATTEALDIDGDAALWDLEVLFTDGDKKRYLQGSVTFNREVTK